MGEYFFYLMLHFQTLLLFIFDTVCCFPTLFVLLKLCLFLLLAVLNTVINLY